MLDKMQNYSFPHNTDNLSDSYNDLDTAHR